jgi:hypothetical protein
LAGSLLRAKVPSRFRERFIKSVTGRKERAKIVSNGKAARHPGA